MFDLKRIHAQFEWNSGSVYGRWSRAIKENDRPYIWLSCLRSSEGRELYCINQTGSPIERLDVIHNTHALVDGEYFNKANATLGYTEIQHDEAVKIAHYDEYYDLDLLLGVTIAVSSNELGSMVLKSKEILGGPKLDDVLLWKNQCSSLQIR